MKVFLDTNVIVDFCAQRGDFYRAAAILIELGRRKKIDLCFSALTVVNTIYLLRKIMDKDNALSVIHGLTGFCQVAPLDETVVREAFARRWKDFEDCTQCLSAETIKADVIITRDASHFTQSTLPVETPSEFLDAFLSDYTSVSPST